MGNLKSLQTTNTEIAALQEQRHALQGFMSRVNMLPDNNELTKTPDGKALSVPISFIEMTLDEYFFGLWETENFKWSVISNEVVGSIDLIVTHPVTGNKLKRTGAAGIIITVNKGANALDVQAKKANALDLGFPKLKAECIKNAAQSIGKLFGRDLNRRQQDMYQPLLSKPTNENLKQLLEAKRELLTEEEIIHAERIINSQETQSYLRLKSFLETK